MDDQLREFQPMTRKEFRLKWGHEPDFIRKIFNDDISEEDCDVLSVALTEAWDKRVSERN